MNTLIALALFGIAVVVTIVLAIPLLIGIIARARFPDGSGGCDFCDSDYGTRLGGGDVACSDCCRTHL
ncbi:hypothetical protein PM023_17440 [Halorubrum ezzemoulense]|jgi:hypothetical protein|uniref:hypothetical protein n=1 Tax=Halorubrum ezzemoulense TaxID=337243 RepID=UPI00232D0EB0|nr:hypothetical protein [Halorubrum ezzemoulense]MDB2226400.1 hypothetical protein [Halorubrum ezzemoulense]